jgi:hypothetical protein
MRRPGADYLVVVMKRGNARGAKGVGHSRWQRRVNGQPEEPGGVSGRRQSSVGGTSRMTRECQVRICERLGVKSPGPTRPGGSAPGETMGRGEAAPCALPLPQDPYRSREAEVGSRIN